MQKMYVSHVPDSQAWEADALNISWEGPVSYVLCVLSSGPHPSGDSTDDHLQVQNHQDCTRVARDVLVLGSGESVHKTPSKTSIVGESVDSTIQQQTSQQASLLESSCLASGVSYLLVPSNSLANVEKRFKLP